MFQITNQIWFGTCIALLEKTPVESCWTDTCWALEKHIEWLSNSWQPCHAISWESHLTRDDRYWPLPKSSPCDSKVLPLTHCHLDLEYLDRDGKSTNRQRNDKGILSKSFKQYQIHPDSTEKHPRAWKRCETTSSNSPRHSSVHTQFPAKPWGPGELLVLGKPAWSHTAVVSVILCLSTGQGEDLVGRHQSSRLGSLQTWGILVDPSDLPFIHNSRKRPLNWSCLSVLSSARFVAAMKKWHKWWITFAHESDPFEITEKEGERKSRKSSSTYASTTESLRLF